MLLPGRMVFALAVAGFGIVSLLYGDFVRQLQSVNELVPRTTPGYGPFAIMTGVFLISAGVAIAARIRDYEAAIAVTVLFVSWIVLLHAPSAFVNPALLRSPWWVRTFETLGLSGASLILAGVASRPARERWVRIGCILFGISLPIFGVLHYVYAGNVASLVPSWYPFPLFWAYFTGTGKIVAGAAITLGVMPRLAATMTAIMYGTYVVTLHIPRQFMEQSVDARANGMTSLFVAVAFCGAALVVAGSPRRQDQVEAFESHSLQR